MSSEPHPWRSVTGIPDELRQFIMKAPPGVGVGAGEIWAEAVRVERAKAECEVRERTLREMLREIDVAIGGRTIAREEDGEPLWACDYERNGAIRALQKLRARIEQLAAQPAPAPRGPDGDA